MFHEIEEKIKINLFKKKVGFCFDNRANYLFFGDHNLTNYDGYDKYRKATGDKFIITELIFYAYQSYCVKHKLACKYSKLQIIKGFSTLNAEGQKRIVKAYESSIKFGDSNDDSGSKKKAK